MRIAGPLLIGQRVELFVDDDALDPYLSGVLTTAELTPDSVRLTVSTDRQPAASAEVTSAEVEEEVEPAAGGVARPSGWS